MVDQLPERPPEAEGVHAWDAVAHRLFIDRPSQLFQPSETILEVAFRLLDRRQQREPWNEMDKVWRQLAKEDPEVAEYYLETAIRRGAQVLTDWEGFVEPQLANQHARIGTLANRLDELLGEGPADRGLLHGVLGAFDKDSTDWSELDVRSMLSQLRTWARDLEGNPEARRQHFGTAIGNTAAEDPNQPAARHLASLLKPTIPSPATIRRTVLAVLAGEAHITEDDIRKVPAAE